MTATAHMEESSSRHVTRIRLGTVVRMALATPLFLVQMIIAAAFVAVSALLPVGQLLQTAASYLVPVVQMGLQILDQAVATTYHIVIVLPLRILGGVTFIGPITAFADFLDGGYKLLARFLPFAYIVVAALAVGLLVVANQVLLVRQQETMQALDDAWCGARDTVDVGAEIINVLINVWNSIFRHVMNLYYWVFPPVHLVRITWIVIDAVKGIADSVVGSPAADVAGEFLANIQKLITSVQFAIEGLSALFNVVFSGVLRRTGCYLISQQPTLIGARCFGGARDGHRCFIPVASSIECPGLPGGMALHACDSLPTLVGVPGSLPATCAVADDPDCGINGDQCDALVYGQCVRTRPSKLFDRCADSGQCPSFCANDPKTVCRPFLEDRKNEDCPGSYCVGGTCSTEWRCGTSTMICWLQRATNQFLSILCNWFNDLLTGEILGGIYLLITETAPQAVCVLLQTLAGIVDIPLGAIRDVLSDIRGFIAGIQCTIVTTICDNLKLPGLDFFRCDSCPLPSRCFNIPILGPIVSGTGPSGTCQEPPMAGNECPNFCENKAFYNGVFSGITVNVQGVTWPPGACDATSPVRRMGDACFCPTGYPCQLTPLQCGGGTCREGSCASGDLRGVGCSSAGQCVTGGCNTRKCEITHRGCSVAADCQAYVGVDLVPGEACIDGRPCGDVTFGGSLCPAALANSWSVAPTSGNSSQSQTNELHARYATSETWSDQRRELAAAAAQQQHPTLFGPNATASFPDIDAALRTAMRDELRWGLPRHDLEIANICYAILTEGRPINMTTASNASENSTAISAEDVDVDMQRSYSVCVAQYLAATLVDTLQLPVNGSLSRILTGRVDLATTDPCRFIINSRGFTSMFIGAQTADNTTDRVRGAYLRCALIYLVADRGSELLFLGSTRGTRTLALLAQHEPFTSLIDVVVETFGWHDATVVVHAGTGWSYLTEILYNGFDWSTFNVWVDGTPGTDPVAPHNESLEWHVSDDWGGDDDLQEYKRMVAEAEAEADYRNTSRAFVAGPRNFAAVEQFYDYETAVDSYVANILSWMAENGRNLALYLLPRGWRSYVPELPVPQPGGQLVNVQSAADNVIGNLRTAFQRFLPGLGGFSVPTCEYGPAFNRGGSYSWTCLLRWYLPAIPFRMPTGLDHRPIGWSLPCRNGTVGCRGNHCEKPSGAPQGTGHCSVCFRCSGGTGDGQTCTPGAGPLSTCEQGGGTCAVAGGGDPPCRCILGIECPGWPTTNKCVAEGRCSKDNQVCAQNRDCNKCDRRCVGLTVGGTTCTVDADCPGFAGGAAVCDTSHPDANGDTWCAAKFAGQCNELLDCLLGTQSCGGGRCDRFSLVRGRSCVRDGAPCLGRRCDGGPRDGLVCATAATCSGFPCRPGRCEGAGQCWSDPSGETGCATELDCAVGRSTCDEYQPCAELGVTRGMDAVTWLVELALPRAVQWLRRQTVVRILPVVGRQYTALVDHWADGRWRNTAKTRGCVARAIPAAVLAWIALFVFAVFGTTVAIITGRFIFSLLWIGVPVALVLVAAAVRALVASQTAVRQDVARANRAQTNETVAAVARVAASQYASVVQRPGTRPSAPPIEAAVVGGLRRRRRAGSSATLSLLDGDAPGDEERSE